MILRPTRYRDPYSNGIATAVVKTFTRNYVSISPTPRGGPPGLTPRYMRLGSDLLARW
jgi:hypothetical protein